MKNKIKDNIYWLAGQFFIWVVPLILIIIMACTSAKTTTQIKLWVVVAILVYIIAYFVKIKSSISKAQQIQLTRDGYTHEWVHIVNWLSAMLPLVCVILFTEKVKECIIANSKEIELFIGFLMLTISIGYYCLVQHSKIKEKALQNKTE